MLMGVVSGPILSDDAYADGSGKVIDGDRVIVAANGAVSSIHGHELLTDSLRRQFQSLQRTGATGTSYLDVVFADSAAGKMLFIVAWDAMSNQSAAGGGLVVYDAAKEVVSSVVTPYREAAYELIPGTPTVHLTPNGQIAVVEEYQWRGSAASAGVSSQQRFKTGTIALYDATSGSQLRTIQLSPAPGESGRFVGFSSDSTLMYYTSGLNMYVVDLMQGESLAFILPQGFSPTKVVTADR